MVPQMMIMLIIIKLIDPIIAVRVRTSLGIIFMTRIMEAFAAMQMIRHIHVQEKIQ